MTYNTMVQVELVNQVCWCGIPHAMPATLVEHQRRQHRNGGEQDALYCPLGHAHIISGEGEAAKLRRELVQSQHRANSLASSLAAEKDARAKSEADLAKTKRRIKCGICPCCKRSFAKLAAHMKTKHPEYAGPSAP